MSSDTWAHEAASSASTLLGIPEWQQRAACGGKADAIEAMDLATKHGTGIGTTAADQLRDTYCAGCPVREDCLLFGLTTRPNGGVWGGERFKANGTLYGDHNGERTKRLRAALLARRASAAVASTAAA